MVEVVHYYYSEYCKEQKVYIITNFYIRPYKKVCIQMYTIIQNFTEESFTTRSTGVSMYYVIVRLMTHRLINNNETVLLQLPYI